VALVAGARALGAAAQRVRQAARPAFENVLKSHGLNGVQLSTPFSQKKDFSRIFEKNSAKKVPTICYKFSAKFPRD
jgi:hypothetical protein